MTTSLSFVTIARVSAILLFCLGIYGLQAESKLFYTKDFPGSMPAFVYITLEPSGKCEYREALDDDAPFVFQLSADETEQIFELAKKLDHFNRPLESPLKVAKMGTKTFRFEDGQTKHEVKYNFSEDLDARALQDWFERVSETAQLFAVLQRSVKYDKLGVNKVTVQIESALTRGRLVSGESFLPLLDRIAKNDAFLNIARHRASQIAELIRHPELRATK